MELPGGADNAEGCGICTTECVGERISRIGIRSSDSRADVCIRGGVFSDDAGGTTGARGEHRCTVLHYISDVDSNSDCVGQTAIGDRNRYGIGSFGFVVECCLGFQLPGCAVNIKCCRVYATEPVGERVVVSISRGYRPTDVCIRCCVLRYCACGTGPFCEYGCTGAIIIIDNCEG